MMVYMGGVYRLVGLLSEDTRGTILKEWEAFWTALVYLEGMLAKDLGRVSLVRSFLGLFVWADSTLLRECGGLMFFFLVHMGSHEDAFRAEARATC